MYMLARNLFALLFLFSGVKHFIMREEMVQKVAAQGIWFPVTLHFLAGTLCLTAGVLLFLGQVRLGVCALWLFLLPATVLMHRFWGLDDSLLAQNQLTQFLKNLSILGGSLFLLLLVKEKKGIG